LIKISDIIYCNFSPPHDIPFYLSKLRLNKKNIVYGFHGEFFLEKEETKNIYDISINEKLYPLLTPLISLYRKISFYLLRRESKKLHVVNKNLERFFLSRNLNAKYIPNPIDFNKFKLADNKKNKFIVLYTGRLEFIKGALVLKETIEKFNKKYGDEVAFIITGGGTYSKEFEILSKTYKNVNYLGFVSFSKLLNSYKQACLYISPSYRDPFPFTLLEAQSAGLHIITTKTSGGEVACPIGKIIVPLGDSDALSKAIHRKYLEWRKDEKAYYKKSKEIRKFVEKNFSFKKVFRDIYIYLLNNSS
jgi:glycosyltransferase involved in cell wall biosynthesis